MKYAVIRVSNGSFKIEIENVDIGIVKDKYFELCRTYLAQANIDAVIKITDGNLDDYEGGKYKEHIVKTQTPAQNE